MSIKSVGCDKKIISTLQPKKFRFMRNAVCKAKFHPSDLPID